MPDLPCLRLHNARPAFGGHRFGDVGAYEWLTGTVRLALNPAAPHNQSIRLLAHAPVDGHGQVVYETDLAILRPVEPAHGNGWLLYDVVNRGNKRVLQDINGGTASNQPETVAESGTGYLIRQGYTMVWSGWQAGLPDSNARLSARLPVVPGMTGLSREEFILNQPDPLREDGVREKRDGTLIYRLSHPIADLADHGGTLTVRAQESDVRVPVAADRWHVVDADHIAVSPGGLPFDRGAIWEFIYRARDPVMAGIGLASIRDLVSFLHHGAAEIGNPLAGQIRHTLAFGLSQSGRVLRQFLYEGFNQDLAGRRVFDGMMPFIAGSRKAFVNQDFAQPGRFSRQHEDHLFPGDQFPFAYATQHDARSGATDGLLAKAEAQGVMPKILHVDSESEMFAARFSLVVTDTDGRDAPQPENVRVYLAAGVAHTDAQPAPTVAQTAGNPLSLAYLARAMAHTMRSWVETGAAPPPSHHPMRGNNTLLPLPDAIGSFPALPQTKSPSRINDICTLDQEAQPPVAGLPYPVFVAPTDTDGNTRSGLLHPLVAAPLGTHTGWQLRRAGFAEGALLSMIGGYIPFAATKADRDRHGDPRPSLEERYGSVAGWKAAVQAALPDLVAAGGLLPEDAERVTAWVEARTDYPDLLTTCV